MGQREGKAKAGEGKSMDGRGDEASVQTGVYRIARRSAGERAVVGRGDPGRKRAGQSQGDGRPGVITKATEGQSVAPVLESCPLENTSTNDLVPTLDCEQFQQQVLQLRGERVPSQGSSKNKK